MSNPQQFRLTTSVGAMRRWVIRWVAAASVLVISLPETAWACPTCKNDLHHSGTDFGFAVSILFMMAAPFCIFAGWAIVIYRLRRQMKSNDAESFDLAQVTYHNRADHQSETSMGSPA